MISGTTFAHPDLWLYFMLGVFAMLALDLFVFNRNDHVIKVKEALYISMFWIAIALSFNAYIWFHQGHDLGTQFLTGYLVEKSLSVDNLFVMLLVFQSFKIQPKYQHRVLFWGILGAIIFRGLLIFVGAELVHRFEWILYIFGAILIYSGVKFLMESDEHEDVTENTMTKFLRRHIPITDGFRGHNFFSRESGRLMATPMFLALCVVEISDIVFAVDSIPAVFAVTQDSFIAFSSNIAAILGLRALYFVVSDSIARFRYLKPGLAAILIFVGLKMLVAHFLKISSGVSLLVIVAILITAALSSWYVNKREVSVLDAKKKKNRS
ncbi:MAG: TerC family protein [Bdellovibrionota bacterium]